MNMIAVTLFTTQPFPGFSPSLCTLPHYAGTMLIPVWPNQGLEARGTTGLISETTPFTRLTGNDSFLVFFFMAKLYTGTLILQRSLSRVLFVIQSLKVQLRESYQISKASKLETESQTMVTVRLLCNWPGSQSLEATL